MNSAEIKATLEESFAGLELQELENSSPEGFLLKADHLVRVCTILRDSEHFFMDMLSCISAIDNGTEAGTIDVIYHLFSITKEFSLTLKVQVSREYPTIPSVSNIWRSADWHEREAYDLLGVHFEGHPDLRRILLPDDWEGHPLRKDYEEQENYHGITVKYDRLLDN